MPLNCSAPNKTLEDPFVNRIRRVGMGYVSLPIASIGLILVSLYIASIIRAMIYRRISRKCYILLMDRAFGDVLACCVAIGIGIYVVLVDDINDHVVGNPELLLIGTFWSSMVSYVSLSVVKLYAVARPLTYRHVFTMRRCIYLIILSWSLYGCVVIPLLVFRQLVRIPALSAWSGCKMETCTRNIHRFRHGLIMFCYTLTIVIFMGTVMYLRRAQRYVTGGLQRKLSERSAKVLRFSIWKLGFNVATFTLFFAFQMAHSTYILVINRDNCLFVENRIRMTTIHSYLRNIMLMRIVVDPIISFFVDRQLRRSFLHMMGIICDAKMPGRCKTYDVTDTCTNTTSSVIDESVVQKPCNVGKFD